MNNNISSLGVIAIVAALALLGIVVVTVAYRQVEFREKASQTTGARLCNTCNTVLVFDADATNDLI